MKKGSNPASWINTLIITNIAYIYTTANKPKLKLGPVRLDWLSDGSNRALCADVYILALISLTN